MTQDPQQPMDARMQVAHDLGVHGGPISEDERLLFEAWMRGHCWALCAEWDGKSYRSHAEQGGEIDPRAMATRRLWAAWRDRAALSAARSLATPADPRATPTGEAAGAAVQPTLRAVARFLADRGLYLHDTAIQELIALAAPPAAEHLFTQDQYDQGRREAVEQYLERQREEALLAARRQATPVNALSPEALIERLAFMGQHEPGVVARETALAAVDFIRSRLSGVAAPAGASELPPLPQANLYAHELLKSDGVTGSGVWLACDDEEVTRKAHDPGETGDEIRALFTAEQMQAYVRAALSGAPAAAAEPLTDWQQYAREGETAKQCIERHRREQDALLKLLAKREPLTGQEVIAMLPAGWKGMLAQVMELARRIEAAHGIGSPCAKEDGQHG